MSLQVRAAAVFALGTYINSNQTERSDHSNNIDHSVARMLIKMVNDGSPLVRKVGAQITARLNRLTMYMYISEFITQKLV